MLHRETPRIRPAPLENAARPTWSTLIETYFNAYNAARLREACQTFARMIDAGATIGVSISGALTPGRAVVGAGAADQARLHRLHLVDGREPLPRPALRPRTCRSTAAAPTWPPGAHDVKLRKDGIIRVYDVLFPADVLYKTDEWVYRVLMAPEFGKRLSGSELHHRHRQVRAGDGAQGGREQAVAAGGLPRATTCRCGWPRRATRPSASTCRPSTPPFPDAAPQVDPGGRRHGDVGAGAGRQAARRAACRAW